eukprot:tig00020909_g15348.t1
MAGTNGAGSAQNGSAGPSAGSSSADKLSSLIASVDNPDINKGPLRGPAPAPKPVSISSQNGDRTGAAAPPPRRKRGLMSRLFCCIGRNRDQAEQSLPPSPDGASKQKSQPQAQQAQAQEQKWLLPPPHPDDVGRKTLVLDLDETLVHSSFKPIFNADIVIPVEIDDEVHPVYVLKRPGLDQFLKRTGEKFEIVVFTASLAKYADPLLDKLDTYKVIRHRLFREACEFCEGNYVKDLSKIGRELRSTIIVDNSPASYMFQPQNAVPVGSFIDDLSDRELYDLIPLLEAMIDVDDVARVLNAEG